MDILCNNINCDGIGMRRADWDNFRECERIMLNGQQIWGYPLSDAVKSQIYEDIVTTGHHSASLAEEVWRAANLYCKSHAATHPDLTAQGKLLSAFVNADKDMYCSLPLALTPEAQSALPTRYAVGDGTASFTTNIVSWDRIVTNVILTSFTASNVFGYNYNNNGTQRRMSFGFNNSGLPTFGIGDNESGYIQIPGGWSLNTPYEIEATFYGNNAKLYQNGTLKYQGTATRSNPLPISIFSVNQNAVKSGMKGKGKDSMVYLNNVKIGHFIPSKISNLMELLDLETLTLATRVGTFTEQKDIPNS